MTKLASVGSKRPDITEANAARVKHKKHETIDKELQLQRPRKRQLSQPNR